jgi:hypothetical protein
MTYRSARRFLFTLVSALLIVASPARADDSPHADWKVFRTKYKFHIQTIAVSGPHTDGSRTLIISEPPPHVTLRALEEVDPIFKNSQVLTNPIGHDGWVKDVVLEVPGTSDAAFQALISRLSRYLFFTTYKTSILPIPISQTATRKNKRLDLRVSAAQVQSWLTGSGGKFVPLLGGESRTLTDILGGGSEGVYLSSSPGLVIWIFPKREDLSVRQIEAREFSLDSDLILGAMGTNNSVVVVGRERVVPCDVLPPLRVETILLLASVRANELSQSYERTNFAAGKFDGKTNADWAPIYLSDELIDTEYGSLLNVTDQLLKSWSSNGTVRYENFDYPDPGSYPFIKPIIQLLKVPVLTFNWNTTGVGYAVAGTKFTTLALHRTGALPVSYIPEGHIGSGKMRQDIEDKEDAAYRYFAGRDDPNLVRVVQYASLYQIFRRFDVNARVPAPIQPNSQEGLTEAVVRTLHNFEKLDEAGIKQNLADLASGGHLTRLEFLEATDSIDHLEEVQGLIREVERRWGEKEIRGLAEMIVNPRANATHSHDAFERLNSLLREIPDAQQAAMTKDFKSPVTILAKLDNPTGLLAKLSPQHRKEVALHTVAGEISEHNSLVRTLTGVSVTSLKDIYETGAKRPDHGWIRTPSIVVSYTQQSLASGGHNLDSRVTEFRESSSVPQHKIEVKVEGEKRILLYNPKDENYPAELTGLVAKYGRFLPDDVLQTVLIETVAKLPPRPQLPRNVALGFSKEVKPSIDRGLQREFTVSGVSPSGFRTVAQQLTAEQSEFVRSLRGQTMKGTVVERRSPTSILIYNSLSGEVIEATDTIGTVDALGQIANMGKREGQRSFFLFKKGFTDEEANGMAGAVRVNAEGSDVDVVLEAEESNAGEMRTLLRDDLLSLQETKVHDPVEISDSNTGLRGVEVTAEIPFRSKVSFFFLRVRLFFRGTAQSFSAFADSVRAAVQESISKIVATGDNWSALRVSTQASRELRKKFGNDNIRILMHQVKDHLVSENIRTYELVG